MFGLRRPDHCPRGRPWHFTRALPSTSRIPKREQRKVLQVQERRKVTRCLRASILAFAPPSPKPRSSQSRRPGPKGQGAAARSPVCGDLPANLPPTVELTAHRGPGRRSAPRLHQHGARWGGEPTGRGDRRWSLRHTASDRGGAAGLPRDRSAPPLSVIQPGGVRAPARLNLHPPSPCSSFFPAPQGARWSGSWRGGKRTVLRAGAVTGAPAQCS